MQLPPGDIENPTLWRGARVPLYLVLLLLVSFLPFQGPVLAQVNQAKEIRRVLVLNELGLWSPGINAIDQEIFAALKASPYQVEFYGEELDTSLFPDEASQSSFRDWYFRKYRDRKPNLIIAVGPSPIKFMADSHEVFAPHTPIVFWGSTEQGAEPPKLDSDFTGVWGVAQPEKTLDLALRLKPGTKHVVVVGGVSPYDRHLEALVKKRFQRYESTLDFTYLTDLAMPTLLERLKHLPDHTIVYHTSIMQDAGGTHFIDATQSAPMVAAAANAPVFAVDDVDVGGGTVGGDVFSFVLSGQVAARMAVRILNGEKPQDIPIVRGASAYMFDWRALQRWGLKEGNLPPGSIVLNRQPSFWEAYERYVIPGILLLLAQALIIIGLLWQRAKRRRTEVQLIRSNERLSMAMESGKSVGWEWDLASGRDIWFGDLHTMFGIPTNTFTGQVGDFYHYVHPDDRQRVSQAVADARENRKPYFSEFRIVRHDGTMRWVVSRGRFDYARNGKPTHMLGMAVDITEFKHAEEARQISDRRFSQFFATLPEYCYITSPSGEILDVNQAACDALGYTKEELVGKPLSAIYAPESHPKMAELLEKCGGTGTHHNEELVILTKQGRKRTVLLNAASVKDSHGNPLHSASVQVDITELKQMQEKLRASEERFRLITNAAPVMIWMCGVDKLCTFVNRPWLEFTGRSFQAELGNGWAEGVHPEDVDGCLETYTSAFDRRESFQMEYRHRRHDGEYRWLSDMGVPTFSADGSFTGYIGSCLDVTESKLAREALSSISRRLIEAQEQERSWIARELHDDINQRIALLAVNLERLKRDLHVSVPSLDERLVEVSEQVSSLGSDVQALSHRLHSSKLEYLGIAAAAASFCKEISEGQGIQIDFHSEGIPKKLPREIALCFFRVLQEAIQNAMKHSGSPLLEVWLRGASNEIELTVGDSGIGFDTQDVMTGRGLGLTSMQERMKLVHGQLFIESQPHRGTLVRARIPLDAATKSASV
jgi:PAS domain S-box-containing protein